MSRNIQIVPKEEQLLILGDLNAKMCADHDSWPSCLGQHGVCKWNTNDQPLLQLCVFHEVCVTNTYFHARDPYSKDWHQLDLIPMRRKYLRNVLMTQSFQNADCDSDHSLAYCKIRL